MEEDAEETSGEQEEAVERSDPDKAGETAMSETQVKPSVPGDQGLTEQSETAVPEEQQNEEEVQQASFTQQHFTLRNGRVIGYWLYTPAGAVENMPLILYLHGGSGKGDDLELVTQADSLPAVSAERTACPGGLCSDPTAARCLQGLGRCARRP